METVSTFRKLVADRHDGTEVLALKLTPREREVVRLLAAGFTYEQMGCALGISLHTIGTHIKNLYRKLEVHNARAAVSRAFSTGAAHED